MEADLRTVWGLGDKTRPKVMEIITRHVHQPDMCKNSEKIDTSCEHVQTLNISDQPDECGESFEEWCERTDHQPMGIACRIWDAAQAALTKRESGRESQQIEILHGDARRKQQMKRLVEENRVLREALHPHAGIKDTYPLILYFDSKADANAFVALVQEAKPGMKSYQLDD